MRRSLLVKLISFFLIFAAAGFLVIFAFTGTFLYEKIRDRESRMLYSMASEMAGTYGADYYKRDTTLTMLHDQITLLSGYMESTVLVMDTYGEVIADSSAAVDEVALTIEDFNPTDFDGYYMIGTFYDTFDEDMLTVISPITINYKVRGYITIHKPVTSINAMVDGLVDAVYITYAVVLGIALLILIIIIVAIYVPLRHIAKAARRFGTGSFDEKIDMTRSDELGVIAASLDAMAVELDTLEDDQKKFISNISHDFRSPLTSIRGYAQAMSDGTIPYELQGKYLDIITFETERLNKLTESLLELNRFGQKGAILDISEFDLNRVIKQTSASFEGRCREKDITIDLILSGDVAVARADEIKIRQVLYNLLDNAIKFSHNESIVTIETTQRSEKIYVAVKDTGIGIPKDEQNKIWDRFYKSDLSRGKDKTGSGLGLAIVKEIIQAHGENINVISTEGAGTQFVFTLPAAD